MRVPYKRKKCWDARSFSELSKKKMIKIFRFLVFCKAGLGSVFQLNENLNISWTVSDEVRRGLQIMATFLKFVFHVNLNLDCWIRNQRFSSRKYRIRSNNVWRLRKYHHWCFQKSGCTRRQKWFFEKGF